MKPLYFLLTLFISVSIKGMAAVPTIEVPQAVLDAFNEKYPTATKAKWEQEDDGNFEVEFKMSSNKYEATFTIEGNWLETEKEIKVKELPAGVLESFKATFPKGKIKEAKYIESATRGILYEVEFKEGKIKKEALFDERGKYITSENDNRKEEEEEEESEFEDIDIDD